MSVGTSDGAPPRLTAKQKSLYAFGDAADAIKNAVLSQFLLYYLTVACGISGSLAGTVLFVALIVDAITDPLFGYLSDRTRSGWGRRHPYMFFAAPPFAIALGMLFSMPAFDSTWVRFAYALVMLVALRVAFSAFSLPYSAMTAELSSDYVDRSVVMTFRRILGICGNTLTVTLGFGVFLAADGALETREAYVAFGWTCALLVLIAAYISAFSTFGIRDRLKPVDASTRIPITHIFSELKEVLANQSFRVLALTVVVFWIAQGTHGSLGVHAFRHFWDLDSHEIRNILYADIAGLVVGIAICAFVLRHYEKKSICAASIAAFCVCQFIPPVLKLADVVTHHQGFLLLSGFAFIMGIAMTCVAITFGSMMADATDEHDLRFGTRREGLYFSGLTFGGKCAIGLGAFFSGIGLDLINFPSDLGTNPGQVIDPRVVYNLGLLYGPGAAVISIVSATILMRHRLDSREHARIQSELALRATPQGRS